MPAQAKFPAHVIVEVDRPPGQAMRCAGPQGPPDRDLHVVTAVAALPADDCPFHNAACAQLCAGSSSGRDHGGVLGSLLGPHQLLWLRSSDVRSQSFRTLSNLGRLGQPQSDRRDVCAAFGVVLVWYVAMAVIEVPGCLPLSRPLALPSPFTSSRSTRVRMIGSVIVDFGRNCVPE